MHYDSKICWEVLIRCTVRLGGHGDAVVDGAKVKIWIKIGM